MQDQNSEHKPTCLIILGMAGSGKTTFVKKLTEYMSTTSRKPYTINLDPAVHYVPYHTNIDIRDTVKFKEVMKQYGYGPNGAIMTSLNFFASQFHKVVDLISKNSTKASYVVLDTPGQIEVFTWSASGVIITETLGACFPTVVIYVMDTPRSHNPITFMSNMLYACSVLYRMRLPFLLVLNKTDIISCDFAIEWMRDFEEFQSALAGHRSADCPAEMENDFTTQPGQSPYMNSLVHSMSLVLDEFYSELRCCGVSSLTGEGLDKFFEELDVVTNEYYTVYLPSLQEKRKKNTMSQGSSQTSPKAVDIGVGKSRFASADNPSAFNSMLLDLAGNDDRAEDDPLPDLDGTELRPENNSDMEENFQEDMKSIDDKFRRLCSADTAGMDSSNN